MFVPQVTNGHFFIFSNPHFNNYPAAGMKDSKYHFNKNYSPVYIWPPKFCRKDTNTVLICQGGVLPHPGQKYLLFPRRIDHLGTFFRGPGPRKNRAFRGFRPERLLHQPLRALGDCRKAIPRPLQSLAPHGLSALPRNLIPYSNGKCFCPEEYAGGEQQFSV
jgi:hypothetical protein